MTIFDRNEFDSIVKSHGLNVPQDVKDEIYDYYKLTMTDEKWQQSDRQTQTSIVDAYLERWEKNIMSPKDSYMLFSSNKHMEYYDNFLGKGEANKIVEALSNNGISLDVLKKIRKNVDLNRDKVGKGVRVTQTTDIIDGSPHIVYFDIEYNGKIIYSYPDGNGDIKELETDIDTDYIAQLREELLRDTRYFISEKNKYNKNMFGDSIYQSATSVYKKDGSKSKEKNITSVFSDGNFTDVNIIETKKGGYKIIYRNSLTGKFTKKVNV